MTRVPPRLGLILGVLLALVAPAGAQTLSQLKNSGANAHCLNMVFLAEGYTAAEQQKFTTDATARMQTLLGNEAWSRFAASMNVFAIYVASAESGADDPVASIVRDTYFNSTYNTSGIDRLLAVPSDATGSAKVYALLNQFVPDYDIVIVLVNATKYGGSGGSIAVTSLNVNSDEILLHELGHSFALLADEYVDDQAAPSYLPGEYPNATQQSVVANVVWKTFIKPTTAIPTLSAPDENTVGLFQGAYYRSVGYYRPTNNSKMRTLARPFGPVNLRAFAMRVHGFDLNGAATVPTITSQSSSAVVASGQNVALQVQVSGTGPFTYLWRFNGIYVPDGIGQTLTVGSMDASKVGTYVVEISNARGTVTGTPIVLTVGPRDTRADFNGDNKPDLLFQNTTTGERVLWFMNGTSHSSSGSLGVYDPAWVIAATGDFNQDGKPDLVWQNTSTGECVTFLMNGSNVLSTGSLGIYDPAWSIAAAGDFNGDGKTDLIWQNSITGDRVIFLMNGTTVASMGSMGNYDPAWSIAAAGDFNQDGKTDLVWQNTSTGERVIFLMNGMAISSGASLGIYDLSWSITGAGDFNQDGKTDLVWQNTSTGERVIFLMNGTAISAGISLGVVSPEWSLGRPVAPRARADFNGDGKSDVVWQNSSTGERVIFLMNGTSINYGVSMGSYDPLWSIAATGDFNGDGKPDLVWQNTATGERVIFIMNGTSISSGVSIGTYSTQWSIAGAGDFNGDGKTDLIWQNTTTGERVIFLMNGTSIGTGVSIGTFSTQWSIAATGDFNQDGKTDLVWQNTTTGERVIFLMNGTSIGTGVAVGTYDPAWSIAGAGDFNGDGKVDLIWQNTTTGERVIFIMSGTSINYGASLGTYPIAWSIRN